MLRYNENEKYRIAKNFGIYSTKINYMEITILVIHEILMPCLTAVKFSNRAVIYHINIMWITEHVVNLNNYIHEPLKVILFLLH